ncbi:MAG: hypothetical protein NTW06_03780 [Candidatus Falkowbacteria bacterium]|nr:hypothetical protein [Candidatus Falkowbacteria bacterium]
MSSLDIDIKDLKIVISNNEIDIANKIFDSAISDANIKFRKKHLNSLKKEEEDYAIKSFRDECYAAEVAYKTAIEVANYFLFK